MRRKLTNDLEISTPPQTTENGLRSWIDENTGRRVWQLTDSPGGVQLGYFRFYKHIPDGRMLVDVTGMAAAGNLSTDPMRRACSGGMGLLDPETGALEVLPLSSHSLRLRSKDGLVWHLDKKTGELWSTLLPDLATRALEAVIPPDIAAITSDITCDGQTLILEERTDTKAVAPRGSTEVEVLWAHFRRERHGKISAYDIPSGTRRVLIETQGVGTFHVDTSPVDPGLVRYARDMLECTGQRMFTVRTDGSEDHIIRPQEFGEMITHEFWWADPSLIGYTYQDRRGDETVEKIPWSEYSPRPTRLGIANLEGEEVFLSEPLNSYHSHLYVSRCGDYVSGEGTDGTSFVFAAAFDINNPQIDMKALATIHTPYSPLAGQYVHADFSADSKWLLYNDLIDGHMQVCRVAIDF